MNAPRESLAAGEEVPPKASALVESLRAFGYDLPTAVADLIDNSITAGATNVALHFHWNGPESWIAVLDDGDGMTEPRLVEAMRLGTMGPHETRDHGDLGRFGLGLKTASFSQCRRLSVFTRRKSGESSFRAWDLDHINATDKWQLLNAAPASTSAIIDQQDRGSHGTLVVWEKLDRLTGDSDAGNHRHRDHFYQEAERVKEHTGMVFHDFMGGPRSLGVTMNDHPILAWNPFLHNHPKTLLLGDEQLSYGGHSVRLRPYVLPHHSQFDDEMHRIAGGPRGWNAHQGFYVYRNNRLLVPGDWLGLGLQKEEHCKLARIRVDIPNDLDHAWHIDVRKSKARPPAALRERILAVAKICRKRANEVYRFRGKVVSRSNAKAFEFLWEQKKLRNRLAFRINRDHPLLDAVRNDVAGKTDNLNALLRLVEESLPATNIAYLASANPDSEAQPFEGAEKEIVEVARLTFRALCDSGKRPSVALERVLAMDPFNLYQPEIRKALTEGRI